MLVVTLVGLSFLLQLAASAIAWQLVTGTRKNRAWILIACGLTILTIRRAVSLFQISNASPAEPMEILEASAALIGSGFLLAGVAFIDPLLRSMNKANRSNRMISELNKVMIHAQDENSLLEQVCRVAVQTGGYRMAWIGLAEKDEQKSIRPAAQAGFDKGYLESLKISWGPSERGKGPTGTAIREGHPVVASQIQTEPSFALWRAEALKRGYGSSIALPLSIQGETIGSWNIYAAKPDAFDAEETTLLEELANDLSFRIDAIRTHAELARSEDKFRYVFDYSPVGKSITLASGEINVNRTFCEMLGYSPEELRHRKWQEITHPDDVEANQSQIDLLTGGKKDRVRFVKRYIHKNGSTVWVDAATALRTDDNGNSYYYITSVIDITTQKNTEEALRTSESIFKAAFETAPIGISLLDKDRNMIDSNSTLERIAHVSKEGLLAGAYRTRKYIRPDGADMPPSEFASTRAIAENRLVQNIETGIVTESGEVIWTSVSASPLDHPLAKYIVITEDITEQKRAEAELRTAHARLQQFVDSNIVGIVVADAKGNVIEANDYYLNLIGYSRQELEQKKVDWRAITPPEWLPLDEQSLQELKERGTCTPYEKEYVRRNGQRVSIFLGDTMLQGPEEEIVAFVLDLSEQKKSEQEIKSLNSRLQMLISAIQELAVARDLETVMACVRAYARKLTGADGSTFVLRDGDQCHYADEDAIEPLWKGRRFPMSACIGGWVMLNKQSAVIEDIYVDPRIPIDVYKNTFVKSLVMVPIRTADPLGAIGNYWASPHKATDMEVQLVQTLADAAARAVENVRLFEELEQRVQERTAQLEGAIKELEAFSYSISHDLRAPLRAMSGFSKILTEDYQNQLPPEAVHYLDLIARNAGQMGELIDDLLRFSRLSRQPLERQPVEMKEMVEAVVAVLKAEQPERPVEIQLGPLPPSQADPSLLKQVWVNLLSNAFKFTGHTDQPCIRVGAVSADELNESYWPQVIKGAAIPQKSTVYYVKDNGVGFDMQYSHKLFGVFQRLHAVDEFPGTGVGLAIVQRIVHRHGGVVWADARVDQGAAFYFTLEGGIS